MTDSSRRRQQTAKDRADELSWKWRQWELPSRTMSEDEVDEARERLQLRVYGDGAPPPYETFQSMVSYIFNLES